MIGGLNLWTLNQLVMVTTGEKKYLKGLGKLKERSSHCTNFVTLKLNTVYSSIITDKSGILQFFISITLVSILVTSKSFKQ